MTAPLALKTKMSFLLQERYKKVRSAVFGIRALLCICCSSFPPIARLERSSIGTSSQFDPMPSSIDSGKATYFNECKIIFFYFWEKMSTKSHLINSKSKMLEYTLTMIKSVVEIKAFISS